MNTPSLSVIRTFSVRTPLLIREVLLAFISEADDFSHPLVVFFGFDEKTFNFIKQAPPSALLKLSSNLVRANAISIVFDSCQVAKIISNINNAAQLNITSSKKDHYEDKIFCNLHVIRILVMFLSDSIYEVGSAFEGVFEVDHCLKSFLISANTAQIEQLCLSMINERSVRFSFDKRKIKERTYAQISYERREGVKDLLVTNKATYALMKHLFSDENEDSVRYRKNRLGLAPLKGRPRTVPMDEFVEFICIWTSNQSDTELARFLMAHRAQGYSFDVLWTLYQKAHEEGHFAPEVMEKAQAIHKYRK
ncbi:MAG: hypothetical protein HRT37_15545 [Alteromonadaceae bacterium]|nr:hypothetical protein [Alteromonadaceae bacterium]